jgi:hypothetical protein
VNAVSASTPLTAAIATRASELPPSSSESPSLLAEPLPGALDGADPMSFLYLFESKDQQLGVDEGAKRIAALQTERHQALQQEQQAIQQAIEASKQRSFWDDLGSICGEVAKVAAVVASVAAAVATLGAATPIAAVAVAGAVLSSASFADSELHVLRALGVEDSIAGWVDMGMSIGGAVLSVGAGMAAGGKIASSTLSTIRTAGAVTAGAAQVGKGACAIEAGEATSRSDQAAADQVVAQAQSDHAARRMQVAIADTQRSDQQSERIMEAIVNTKTIQNETSLNTAIAVRG